MRQNHYDDAGRLWKIEEGSPIIRTTEYAYDRLGNRRSEAVFDNPTHTTVTSLATTFDGAGMLLSVSGTKDGSPHATSYAYDKAGSLTQRTEGAATRTLHYDATSRLVAVLEAGTELQRYAYNHEGRRIEVADASNVRQYLYDERSLLAEYTPSTLERRYLYADRLIGLTTDDDANTYEIHLDPLGSTLEITEPTAASASSRVYDPWGGIDPDQSTGDPTLSKVLFTGHQHDEVTGFLYFGARYYDPEIARFTTQDPYDGDTNVPPSLNKYLYAYANPLRYVDLEGYATKEYVDSWTRREEEQRREDEGLLAYAWRRVKIWGREQVEAAEAKKAAEVRYKQELKERLGQKGYERHEKIMAAIQTVQAIAINAPLVVMPMPGASVFSPSAKMVRGGLTAESPALRPTSEGLLSNAIKSPASVEVITRAAEAETVTYYRVEGRREGVSLDQMTGNVRFKEMTLQVSTGGPEHAYYFQGLKPSREIIAWEVPKWFDDFVLETQIPQAGYKANPLNQGGLAPKVVDPTKPYPGWPGRSLELPEVWVKWMNEYTVEGSGRIVPPQPKP